MRATCFRPKSLQDGFEKGYFAESISRDEFMDRVTKHNPHLRWTASETHRGLYDPLRKRKQFLCGVSHNYTVPKHSMLEYHPEAEKKHRITNEWGEVTSIEKEYTRENEDIMLVRGWADVFDILERRGYKIDREGL